MRRLGVHAVVGVVVGVVVLRCSDVGIIGGTLDSRMRPYEGFAVIAEYDNRWEADVAAARLKEAGCDAKVFVGSGMPIASHHTTGDSAVLVVPWHMVETAADLLSSSWSEADPEGEYLDSLYHHRRFVDRPSWVRFTTWMLMIAIPGPLVVVAIWLLWQALRSIFP